MHRTAATPIASGPGHAAIRSRLALLRSAAVTGAARGAYRLTKAYVSERHPFGAPLLRIPAVSSGLAPMVQPLQAEAALTLARHAVTAGAGPAGIHAETGTNPAGPNETSAVVAVARITTAQAATEVARPAHQLQGAMGITQEYALHHVTRRLRAWRDAVAR
ncbi:acyl-CoA dehydrogenase family protein [Streptomyces sp. QTS52]